MQKINKSLFFITNVTLIITLYSVTPNTAGAWFGAGKTPGWAPTTTGLSGEIQLPFYKFAPDFYRVGDIVNITTTGFNPSSLDVSAHYYLAVNKVVESPIGTNITDGTPTTPGINENDLNTNHQANNDIQTQVALIDLGSTTFPAMSQNTVSASYKTTETGYYQFDFIDIDPAQYVPGHILSAGFFRVLPPLETAPASPTPTPTGTPSPSSTPTPTPAPTATPAPTQSSGGESTNNSSSNNSNSTSESGSVAGASTEKEGSILGYADAGVFEDTLMSSLGLMGGLMTALGSKLRRRRIS